MSKSNQESFHQITLFPLLCPNEPLCPISLLSSLAISLLILTIRVDVALALITTSYLADVRFFDKVLAISTYCKCLNYNSFHSFRYADFRYGASHSTYEMSTYHK